MCVYLSKSKSKLKKVKANLRIEHSEGNANYSMEITPIITTIMIANGDIGY